MAATWQSRKQLCAKHSKNSAGGIAKKYKYSFHLSKCKEANCLRRLPITEQSKESCMGFKDPTFVLTR